MDIYQVLQKDHLKLKGLFDQIIKRIDKDDWEDVYDLYSCLKAEMISHARAEEDTFHCFLVDENNNPDPINWECKEEHHVIALMILSLAETNMNTKEWVLRFKHLQKNVTKHIDGEEKKIFKKARGMFSDKQAEQMAINMLEMKDRIRIKTEQILSEEQHLVPLFFIEKEKGDH